MTPDDVKDVLFPVADVFGSLGIEWYICGSLAARAWGLQRVPNDIDIMTTVNQSHKTLLELMLSNDYYIPLTALDDAINTQKLPFSLTNFNNPLKICVYVSKGRPFDLKCFDRALMVHIIKAFPRQVPIQSAEDVVLQKLLWYQEGNRISTKQWNDVQQVLTRQLALSALDTSYLQNWAMQLGISGLLAQALSAVTPPP